MQSRSIIKIALKCWSKSARIKNSWTCRWFTRGMHVVESYVATARNDITAPRRLATLSVGSMGKTPRLGSKIRAIDSYRSYGRPMRASSPLKNTRLPRKKRIEDRFYSQLRLYFLFQTFSSLSIGSI